MKMDLLDFKIQLGYRPGLLGAMIAMNADHYVRIRGFNPKLEANIASELGFVWQRYSADFDALIYAEQNGPIVGGAVLDGVQREGSLPLKEQHVKLKWFIVGNNARGCGLGRALLNSVVEKARDMGYGKLVLTTDKGAEAAFHLYKQAGFVEVGQIEDSCYEMHVTRHYLELDL